MIIAERGKKTRWASSDPLSFTWSNCMIADKLQAQAVKIYYTDLPTQPIRDYLAHGKESDSLTMVASWSSFFLEANFCTFCSTT